MLPCVTNAVDWLPGSDGCIRTEKIEGGIEGNLSKDEGKEGNDSYNIT